MKLKLLLATSIILNLTVSKTVLAQANFGNRPLDINRAPESQILEDFNLRVEQEVDLLQINRANILNIPRDYEHLDSNVNLFNNNAQSKDKSKNSTIFYLDRDTQPIFKQN